MFYKLGHSTYTQTENQQYNNTYVNNGKKKKDTTYTHLHNCFCAEWLTIKSVCCETVL